jgi:hypothetical protein
MNFLGIKRWIDGKAKAPPVSTTPRTPPTAEAQHAAAALAERPTDAEPSSPAVGAEPLHVEREQAAKIVLDTFTATIKAVTTGPEWEAAWRRRIERAEHIKDPKQVILTIRSQYPHLSTLGAAGDVDGLRKECAFLLRVASGAHWDEAAASKRPHIKTEHEQYLQRSPIEITS